MSKKNVDPVIQYRMADDAFVRCGRTQHTVPAGFYDAVNMGQQGWGLRPKAVVTDDLIDIPGTVADDIFGDIDSFMAAREQYMAYSLTHKRGYLFFGPPGSGKTSLGMMLANRFVARDGVVIFVADVSSFFHGVGIMRDVEPGRPTMYLIEEADSIVNNVHCLSILDGECSIQGAVFVAMTNYKKKLPPRIANRPGRFDRVVRVDCPPEAVQLEYLRRVEGRVGGRPEIAQLLVETLRGLPVSMAHLREAFISHVLMGHDVLTVRDRFDAMAGITRDGGGTIVDPDAAAELVDAPSPAVAPTAVMSTSDDDDCDDEEDDDDEFVPSTENSYDPRDEDYTS